jgi:hypothetical protein
MLVYTSFTKNEINVGRNLQSAFHKNVPAGGVGSVAVCGESVPVDGLKGCYWWKTV